MTVAAEVVTGLELGREVDLDVSGAWVVDPDSGRQGAADVVVRAGLLEAIEWRDDPGEVDDRGVVVAPGFLDLRAHVREPGDEAAETVASALAAASHGGFTAICTTADTDPPADRGSLVADALARAARSRSPVRVLPSGAITVARSGEQLAPLGALAEAGAVLFSDGTPVADAALLRNALAYAGMLGVPLVDRPDEPQLADGAEAHDGLVATVLGLRGWPAAGEAAIVARDLAILEDVRADVPGVRLHLAALSTAAALELVRAAKARRLPVTCDVTPPHAVLTDEWLAGARRWAWQAVDADGRPRDPWRDGVLEAGPYDPSLRVEPPLRGPTDALACLAAIADGTADAVATDHAPCGETEKAVEFGLAAPGIASLETTLGLLLEAVDAGRLPLERLIAALTLGPARVLGDRRPRGLVVGAPADLVVFDRADRWTVEPASLASQGFGHPLLGRSLPGSVLVTIADGRLAHRAVPD